MITSQPLAITENLTPTECADLLTLLKKLASAPTTHTLTRKEVRYARYLSDLIEALEAP